MPELDLSYSDHLVELYQGDCRDLALDEPAKLVLIDPPWGETKHWWDEPIEELPKLCAEWQQGLGTVMLNGSFAFLARAWPDWIAAGYTYRWDMTLEWPNGTGINTGDRPHRVHEQLVCWSIGPWADLHHDCPKTTGHPRKRVTRRNTGSHRGAAGISTYDSTERLMRSVQHLKLDASRVAPCQKPVGLYRQLVSYGCPPGGLVIDPTCASGASLVGARQEGRRAIGVEAQADLCAKSLVWSGDQAELFSGSVS